MNAAQPTCVAVLCLSRPQPGKASPHDQAKPALFLSTASPQLRSQRQPDEASQPCRQLGSPRQPRWTLGGWG